MTFEKGDKIRVRHDSQLIACRGSRGSVKCLASNRQKMYEVNLDGVAGFGNPWFFFDWEIEKLKEK